VTIKIILLTTATLLATVSLASAADKFDWSKVPTGPMPIVPGWLATVPAAPTAPAAPANGIKADPVLTTPPPVEKLSSLELHRNAFENALRAYNDSKVKTKKHRDYVVSLRAKYAAEDRRFNTPPPEYDHPFTGTLTIERVGDQASINEEGRCPKTKNPIGCAVLSRDRSSCTVYIVTDENLKKRYALEIRRLFDFNYESILRHERAHCNGWPGDHSRPTATAKQ
jgi:hypothetical protein